MGRALTGFARHSTLMTRLILPTQFASALAVLLLGLHSGRVADAQLSVTPARIQLERPEGCVQVVVTETLPDGRQVDRTRDAQYEVVPVEAPPAATGSAGADAKHADAKLAGTNQAGSIAVLEGPGQLVPRAEGRGQLRIRYGDQQQLVPIEVSGLQSPRPVSFRDEILPLLTKSGCNSGGCHGKAEGQNGFRLSVFGFDAPSDHNALVKEGRGRRLQPAAPRHSLLLRKATAEVPHGGGQQLAPGSYGYRRLLRWIAEGARLEVPESSPITAIRVEPAQRRLSARGTQQLRVVALDAEGHSRDVTVEAEYESNDTTIAGVDPQGHVTAADLPGESAILVRYRGHVAVCRISVPRPGVRFARPEERNFIDPLVWDKLESMGIEPSGPADDATFLRRVYLDTIGTLPTADEAREFLASEQPDKRGRLIDQLLQRDEYATYWSLRWADLLRVDSNALGSESAVAVVRWLRRQLAENRPYDEFVREIVTARGHTRAESPAAIYLALNEPKEISRSFSQLFLGVRIECAECHHHPFEKWSQQDFFALTGYFTGLKRKKAVDGATVLFPEGGADLKHPRTGEVVPAAPLGAPATEFTAQPGLDRRAALARWMTDRDNPLLARTIANRLWAHYFGRGLVEPLDDMRATNPATNEPLLEALAAHLTEIDYDLRAFTRTLLNSAVYQRSAVTNASNRDDRQNFSHAADRTLPAEVLLDAICQVTGVPEKFNGWPVGSRAIEVWDNRIPSYFLTIFGRPGRTSVCECDRGTAPSISQALHLMNSPEIVSKIQHRQGRARQLAESDLPPEAILDQLYLAALSRPPRDDERQLLLTAYTEPGADRRKATEDVLWVLLNSKEFLYNH